MTSGMDSLQILRKRSRDRGERIGNRLGGIKFSHIKPNIAESQTVLFFGLGSGLAQPALLSIRHPQFNAGNPGNSVQLSGMWLDDCYKPLHEAGPLDRVLLPHERLHICATAPKFVLKKMPDGSIQWVKSSFIDHLMAGMAANYDKARILRPHGSDDEL
jgi:hypothetical protein